MSDTRQPCNVTHAPGGHYVCWVHRRFLPWGRPFSTTGCACEERR